MQAALWCLAMKALASALACNGLGGVLIGWLLIDGSNLNMFIFDLDEEPNFVHE
jgi:hypothetical protein